MPDHTYTTREKSAPGFKAFKDRFTLLLGANLTGDCKLKPALVYHAENPHALKGYDKTSLPVRWFANFNGWMMGHIFQAYSKTQLVHELKEYCMSGLPLLYPDGPRQRSCHPQVLQDLHQDIKFVFLPPNTMSLLQPMDQGVIKTVQGALPSKVMVFP